MLRVLHTSDWHLGHKLHSVSRHYEHQCFLDWLQQQLKQRQVDVLIVAGDIFDTANPAAMALSQFYTFIADCKKTSPELHMIFIGGNHDSAARLDAPSPITQAFNVHLLGAIPQTIEDEILWDSLILPLKNAQGDIEAWCAAMPFLRQSDLARTLSTSDDPLIDGVRQRYAQLFTAIEQHRQPHQGLIATGHCYMVNSQISELSERRILGGNQHALPMDIFPTDLTYVALGHLHKAQKLGSTDAIRYSGSPIPLSLGEMNYRHQVILLELDGNTLAHTESISIPRSVEILRFKPANLADQLSYITDYPWDDSLTPETYPFLEVRVTLSSPEPTATQQIQARLKDKPVRLLKITLLKQAQSSPLAEAEPQATLQDLLPQDVFVRCYQRQYSGQPSEQLMQNFHQLLEQVQEEQH